MKICLLTHSYPRFPGDWRSNFLASLARAYLRQGAEVTVLVPRSAEWAGGPGPEDRVKLITYPYLPFKSWERFGYGRAMKGDLKFSFWGLCLAPLIIMSGIIALGRAWRREGFDLVQAHWALPNTLIAVWARRVFRCRGQVFTSFPGSDVTALVKLGWLGRGLAKQVARSDYLSCNSSDLKEELVERCRIPAERIDYVIYGVEPELFRFSQRQRLEARRALGIEPEENVLLAIGRFVKKKGFATAIKALPAILKLYPQTRLVLIGSGPLKVEYRQLIRELGLESRVLLPGAIPLDRLPAVYRVADLFLMPSERLPADGLNTVVPEALAAGLAVVASGVGGNDLVIRDGYNGILHAPGDHHGLAAGVVRLIASATTKKTYARRGRAWAKTKFSWDAIACYNLSVYQKLKEGRTWRD